MKKQALSLFLILCTLLSLTACAKFLALPREDPKARPDDWDVEAELLDFCNGFYLSKTAKDMRPYVISTTSNERLDAIVGYNNLMMKSILAGAIDYRDYPYDSIEVTLLDTQGDFEIFWVKPVSSGYQKAMEEAQAEAPKAMNFVETAPYLIAVTIENGRYVACLEESEVIRSHSGYDYCSHCNGQGSVMVSQHPCDDCDGTGLEVDCLCKDCGEVYPYDYSSIFFGDPMTDAPEVNVILPGADDQQIQPTYSVIESDGSNSSNNKCIACGGTNIERITNTCPACEGLICDHLSSQGCDVCEGKGWIKHT